MSGVRLPSPPPVNAQVRALAALACFSMCAMACAKCARWCNFGLQKPSWRRAAHSPVSACGTTTLLGFGSGRAKGWAHCAYPALGYAQSAYLPRRCNGGRDSLPPAKPKGLRQPETPRPGGYASSHPHQGYSPAECPCPNRCLAHTGARQWASHCITWAEGNPPPAPPLGYNRGRRGADARYTNPRPQGL